MSELAKSSRTAMKEKIKRLVTADPNQKVDSSTWTPPAELDADVKTGARPLIRRIYKSGGKVEGKVAKKRADRVARKSGGRTGEEADRSKRYLTPDNLINRDVRMANDDREGKKHVGAFKKGGRVHKEDGGGLQTETIRHPVGERPKGIGWVLKQAGEQTGKDYSVWGRKYKDIPNLSTKIETGLKSGGRAKKMDGGSLSPEQMAMIKQGIDPFGGDRISGLIASAPMPNRASPVRSQPRPARVPMPPRRPGSSIGNENMNAMGPMTRKKGGKVSEMEWEHSKEDLKQDKKLAKKHGMSLEKWEKSDLDKKHDKQQSAEGLCYGGKTKKADGGKIKWIQGAIKHPGSLHKALKVPAGEKIPAKKLEKAAHSNNPKLAKKANLAKTLRSMHAKGGEVFSGNSTTKIPGVVGGRKARLYGGRAPETEANSAFRDIILSGGKKNGGRTAHAKGGKTKGKTNISININPQAPNMPLPMPPMGMKPPMPPMAPPMAPPPGGAPMGGGAPDPALLAAIAGGMKGGAGAPPMDGAMPRKFGGRANKFGGGAMGGRPMPTGMGGRGMPPGFRGNPTDPVGQLRSVGGGQMMPSGGGMLPPGSGGMPMVPMARKSGGRTTHIIDHAAGGGLGRKEKIKAYGEPQKRMK